MITAMKRYSFLTICLLALAFQGCQEENPGSGWIASLTARYLKLETTNLSFGASTNLTQNLNVSATTTSWQFTGMDSWLTLSPTSGNETATVQATAAENLSTDNSRTCILTFASTASDYPYNTQVQATQSYAEPYIRLSESSLAFDGKASTAKVNVTANNAWTASVSSEQSWLTVETASDASYITVKVTENTTNASRQATVTLAGKTTATLTVVQALAKIEGDQATLTYKQSGGTYQLSISSEASWTASTEQTWIQIDPAKGSAGTTQLLISVTPNESTKERKGWVTFYIGTDKRIEVAVVQAGMYFEVAEGGKATIPSKGGSHTVSFKTNRSWSVESGSSWLTAAPLQGSSDGSVTWTAGDYPSIYSRSDTSYICPENLEKVQVITTQAGRYLRADHNRLSFFAKGGTSDKVIIETDATYTIGTETSWLTIQKDGDTFTATAESYSGNSQREGKITLKMTGLQAGESFKIEIPVAQYADGAHFTIENYSADESWSVAGESSATITVVGFGDEEDWTLGAGN